MTMQIQSIINDLESKLISYDQNIFEKYNVEKTVKDILSQKSDFLCYDSNDDIVNKIESMRESYDDIALYYYNKLIMVNLIKLSRNNISNYPETIKDLFYERFKKIINDIQTNPCTPYNFNNDIFRKDLSICSLRMFPAGAQVVHVSGLGRKFLISGGVKQLLNSSFFFLTKMKKKYPYYQIHTDSRCLNEFNPVGWDKCYIRIAEMLKINPDIKGLFGGSWFYDPVLEKISPRLSYLRKVPISNGAKIFRVGPSESDIKNATATSKTRYELYQKNIYIPTGYIMIWMREKLIEWADKNREKILGEKENNENLF